MKGHFQIISQFVVLHGSIHYLNRASSGAAHYHGKVQLGKTTFWFPAESKALYNYLILSFSQWVSFLIDVIKTKPAFRFLFLKIQNKNSLQKNYNGIKQGTKERGKFY